MPNKYEVEQFKAAFKSCYFHGRRFIGAERVRVDLKICSEPLGARYILLGRPSCSHWARISCHQTRSALQESRTIALFPLPPPLGDSSALVWRDDRKLQVQFAEDEVVLRL